MADEIWWSITGIDEGNKSADTGVDQQNLEQWLSNIENGLSEVVPRSNDPDQLVGDDDESDDEPEISAAFPNIDAVREFLLADLKGSKSSGMILPCDCTKVFRVRTKAMGRACLDFLS